MKKRLKQTLSMLLISMMLVSLFPSGAWAEEAIQGSTGKNWFQEFGSSLTAKWEQEKTNPLPGMAADPLDLTAESQPPETAEQNIQTTAVEGDYEYAVVEGGVTITKYKGTGGNVTIPATLGGLPVTRIGDRAFNQCRRLTSISLPEGLTSIGDWAFNDCSSLTSISLPKGLTSIGDWAFFMPRCLQFDIYQYVLQQLKTIDGLETYYWSNDRGSAEIDFLIDSGKEILPIEVKAETNLKAKSLKTYHQKFQPRVSIRTAMTDYKKEDWLLNLPLWAIGSLKK